MFDKSLLLNFKLSLQEFAIGTGLSVFAGVLLYPGSGPLSMRAIYTGSILQFLALGMLIASIVLLIMGFHKLLYKSLFTEEAGLYMSLPFSGVQMVLSKVFVGSFWLLLNLTVWVFSVSYAALQSGNIFSFLIESYLLEGIDVNKIAGYMVLLLWADILSVAVFVASLLFAMILANTINIKGFRFGANILIVLACLAVNSLIFRYTNTLIGYSPISLLVPLAMLVVLVYFSQKLLKERYSYGF